MKMLSKANNFVKKYYEVFIMIYFTLIWVLSVINGIEVSNNSIFIGVFMVAIRMATSQDTHNETVFNIKVEANNPEELYEAIKTRINPILNSEGDE